MINKLLFLLRKIIIIIKHDMKKKQTNKQTNRVKLK